MESNVLPPGAPPDEHTAKNAEPGNAEADHLKSESFSIALGGFAELIGQEFLHTSEPAQEDPGRSKCGVQWAEILEFDPNCVEKGRGTSEVKKHRDRATEDGDAGASEGAGNQDEDHPFRSLKSTVHHRTRTMGCRNSRDFPRLEIPCECPRNCLATIRETR